MPTPERKRLRFKYTNHRGEEAVRTIIPSGVLQFRTLPPWYPEPTWLVRGYCTDKHEFRDFQLSKMRDIVEIDP